MVIWNLIKSIEQINYLNIFDVICVRYIFSVDKKTHLFEYVNMSKWKHNNWVQLSKVAKLTVFRCKGILSKVYRTLII